MHGAWPTQAQAGGVGSKWNTMPISARHVESSELLRNPAPKLRKQVESEVLPKVYAFLAARAE